MKTLGMAETVWLMVLLMVALPNFPQAWAGETNRPPLVSVTWPYPGTWWSDTFRLSTLIKIKAEATDPDGSVAQVQFFIETNLVGVATNRPFNITWQVGRGVPVPWNGGLWTLKAVAIDDSGARSESNPVRVHYVIGAPPRPVLVIVSPSNGAIFAAPATFVFSAEVLASTAQDAGPVEFFIGTNSVGLVDAGALLTATTPPSSVTVSNLLEGEYKLTVRFRGGDGLFCPCNRITNTIRVVKLGMQLPRLTADGRFQVEVLTSFPGKETIIQASSNLVNWFPISTNQPLSNAFTFTESSPATKSQRFYRVSLPPE